MVYTFSPFFFSFFFWGGGGGFVILFLSSFLLPTSLSQWVAMGKNTRGGGEEGEERVFVESHTQNNVVLGFPSIFMVSTNGRGQIIKGW
jgi:hypothetical protein